MGPSVELHRRLKVWTSWVSAKQRQQHPSIRDRTLHSHPPLHMKKPRLREAKGAVQDHRAQKQQSQASDSTTTRPPCNSIHLSAELGSPGSDRHGHRVTEGQQQVPKEDRDILSRASSRNR